MVVFDRHSILVGSIGPFENEVTSYNNIIAIFVVAYLGFISLTISQFILYHFYNGKYHPYKELLMDGKKLNLHEEIPLMEPVMKAPSLNDNSSSLSIALQNGEQLHLHEDGPLMEPAMKAPSLNASSSSSSFTSQNGVLKLQLHEEAPPMKPAKKAPSLKANSSSSSLISQHGVKLHSIEEVTRAGPEMKNDGSSVSSFTARNERDSNNDEN